MTLPEQILCCKAEGKVCRPVVAEHAKLSRQHSAPKIQDTLPVILDYEPQSGRISSPADLLCIRF